LINQQKMNKTHAPHYSLQDAKPTRKVESVQILKAYYGVPDIKMIEVEKVEFGKKVSNRLAGEDPLPGKKKVLILDLMENDKKFTLEFKEGEVIRIQSE
jgi:hypothetical protein